MNINPQHFKLEFGAYRVPVVIGLDLSLRCAAAIAVPVDFGEHLDWRRCRWQTFGDSLPKTASVAERCRRMRDVADGILAFVRSVEPAGIVAEEMAFGQSGAMAREIGGLTWTVRLALTEAGYSMQLVTSSAARKVLLGKVPRKGAKDAVQAALRSIEAPFHDSTDVCDAFAAANYSLPDFGGRSLMMEAAAA